MCSKKSKFRSTMLILCPDAHILAGNPHRHTMRLPGENPPNSWSTGAVSDILQC